MAKQKNLTLDQEVQDLLAKLVGWYAMNQDLTVSESAIVAKLIREKSREVGILKPPPKKP